MPFLKFKIWPMGGSISFAMIPVFILAFLWGILQIATGNAYILNFWQGLIEYALAFTVIGLAGIFANSLHQAIKEENTKTILTSIIGGVLLGGSARFLMHFIAGIIFFG